MATLNRLDGTFEIPAELPVIALRDLVFFPYMVVPLLIGRAPSVAALEAARGEEGLALLVAQKDATVDEPERDDLYSAGTVIRVVQVSHLADGTARVVMEGMGRARVERFLPSEAGYRAEVALLTEWEFELDPPEDPQLEALAAAVGRMFREYVRLSNRIPNEVIAAAAEISDRVRLTHLIAGHLVIGTAEKQELLEQTDTATRFEILRELLGREVEILRIQEKLDEQIRMQTDAGAPTIPLEEQIGSLIPEPGGTDPEWDELERKIGSTPLTAEARDRVDKEFDRLRKLNPVAPEAAVIRSYLDWILALPWEHETADSLDVGRAEGVLEGEHYGLEEVKERILDHIAVLSLV
ncbi:MAG: endopeptidase La, partial [Gemmatimonadetes bacterium]|nr:endopeptidase La [Gemmatimonadota bacterium]